MIEKTIEIKGYTIKGFESDYVFKTIFETQDFYESECLNEWKKYALNKELILDIGANIGNHTVFWAGECKVKKLICFEPIKDIFEVLQFNVERNYLTQANIFNLAVGDKPGRAAIKTQDPTNSGATALEYTDENDTIEVVTVDGFISENEAEISLMKIDVEGFELAVLKGADKTIDRLKPTIWVEVSVDSVEQVIELLEGKGYVLVDIKKFNMLFVHKDKLEKDERLIETKQIIAGMLKNLEASWTYRNLNLSAEGKVKSRDELINNMKEITRKNEVRIKESDAIIRENKHLISEKVSLIKKNETLINEQKKQIEKYRKLERNFVRFFIHYVKKFVYRIVFRIYKMFESKPRFLRFLLKINNKLGIIKDYKSVLNNKVDVTSVTPIHIKDDGSEIKKIKVAMIADEFTYNCFRYECQALPLTPTNWLDVFTKNKPDIFFCESAWSGTDPKVRPWKGKIYCSVNFKYENRAVLLQILNYCSKHSIPTVFWNKEDPSHYMDKVHNFVDTALKFDHIFTSAEECVERYKNEYKHPSVHSLMFATQPMLFNPIESFERTDEIVFAGSWYAQHPERCKEMEKILDNIILSVYPLKIYDRHSGTADSNHFFPEKYKPYILPALKYEELDLAYKGSKYALNINTSTDSETMFARRVFELMSSNTCVLSNYSYGMHKIFGNNVFFVNEGIDIKDAEKAREKNLYHVLGYHTYANRFHQILSCIGYKYDSRPSALNVYRLIDYESQIDGAINGMKLINYVNKKCVVLLSERVPNTRVKDIYEKYSSSEVEVVSVDYLRKYDRDLTVSGHFVILDNDNSAE